MQLVLQGHLYRHPQLVQRFPQPVGQIPVQTPRIKLVRHSMTSGGIKQSTCCSVSSQNWYWKKTSPFSLNPAVAYSTI